MEWRFDRGEEIYASSLRQEVMSALRRGAHADSDFAAAELIYGELIGNAIRHARGKVRVRLDWDGEFPSLWVHDEGERYASPIALPADPLAESGRGLYIVKALARDFRVERDESSGSAACAILPIRRGT